MLNWILLIIQYGPSIVKLIREIIAFFADLTPEQRVEAEAELKNAKADYKLFKDRRPLERLRDKMKQKCDVNANRC